MDGGWVFDGGRVCVDFTNTLRDRLAGGRELLGGGAELVEWLGLAGLPAGRRVTASDLVEAVELRESVDRVIQGGRPPAADLRRVNAAAVATPPPAPQLRYDAEGNPRLRPARPADPVRSAFAALAVDAIQLVAAGARARVCAAEDCGLRFVDVSPKGNRQWCSMARCGNRAKARAHYARRDV